MFSSTAQAGLFDDEEARKAILDLRSRLSQADESGRARAAEIAQLTQQVQLLVEQLQGLRRNLLDMNNQLEALRAEVSQMRGSQEQLARDLSELQKRQRDMAQGIDDRIRKLEPIKVSLDGVDFLAEPEEKRQFEEALGVLRSGDFDKALGALMQFQRRYPGSGYSDLARFWTANALYGRRDYKESVAAFRGFVSAAPQHPKAPEALLAVANSQVEAKDKAGARKTLDELVKTYPQSEAAKAGKERLATLK
jgi:tol-pal system protein YbgF